MTRLALPPLAAVQAEIARRHIAAGRRRMAALRTDPVGYARQVLGAEPTPQQQEIARALLCPPYRVLVRSGHNVGKTWMVSWLINWWFDTRDPGMVWSTAPSYDALVDGLWTEVRLQRLRAALPDHFIGPAAPQMQTGPDHVAKGLTASKGGAFQGKHREHQLFAFDEAEDVDRMYWTTTDTMFQPDGTNGWIAILNPVTTTSQAFLEEKAVGADGTPKWRVFTLSALEHPNVRTGLDNRRRGAVGTAPLPVAIPTAVTLEQVDGWVSEWFDRVDEPDHDVDVEWPPDSGQWWHPDPDGESRVLGRRPTSGSWGVWTERAWDRACVLKLHPGPADLPELGADIGREGPDASEFHSRCGPCSLAHETHKGWDTGKSAYRLMELADALAAWKTRTNPPQQAPVDAKRHVRIKVDDTGVGGGVTDRLREHGYFVVAVNSGTRSVFADKYPLVRDELWFALRARAKADRLDLSRLPQAVRAELGRQALAPTWDFTPSRQRKVEPKADTKKRLKRSPDGMDAVNLAYYEAAGASPAVVEGEAPRQPFAHPQGQHSWAGERGMFGMGR